MELLSSATKALTQPSEDHEFEFRQRHSQTVCALCVGGMTYSVNHSDTGKLWVSVSLSMWQRADSTFLQVFYAAL